MRRTHAISASLALTLGLLVVACSADPVAAPSETAEVVAEPASPTPTPSPTPTSTPTPEVTVTPVALDLPRSVVHGGLEVTVGAVEVGNATPATALDAEPEPGEDVFAYLDVTMGWEDGYPGGSTQVEVDWFSLVLEDGSVVPSTPVDFRSAYPVREGQPAALTLAFAVTGADEVATAALRVAPVGHLPAVLALAGALPDEGVPVALDVAGEAQVSIEGGCQDGLSTVTLTGGEVDLDGGTDHDGDRVVLNGTARAETGAVFVRLSFRTVAESGSCGGAIVNDDQYRLSVDGLPTAPLNSVVDLLDPGTGIELTFAWMVPVDADLEVIVGTVDGTTATFPVPLPDVDLPA